MGKGQDQYIGHPGILRFCRGGRRGGFCGGRGSDRGIRQGRGAGRHGEGMGTLREVPSAPYDLRDRDGRGRRQLPPGCGRPDRKIRQEDRASFPADP